MNHIHGHFGEGEEFTTDEREIASGTTESEASGLIFTPYGGDDVWGTCVSADEK
jgi:hypothetical protein